MSDQKVMDQIKASIGKSATIDEFIDVVNKTSEDVLKNSLKVGGLFGDTSQMQADLHLRMAELKARNEAARNAKSARLERFKDVYVHVRSTHLTVEHESALVLARQIFDDLDKISYDDLM